MKINLALRPDKLEEDVEYFPFIVGNHYVESADHPIGKIIGKKFKRIDLKTGKSKDVNAVIDIRCRSGSFSIDGAIINIGSKRNEVFKERDQINFLIFNNEPDTVYIDINSSIWLRRQLNQFVAVAEDGCSTDNNGDYAYFSEGKQNEGKEMNVLKGEVLEPSLRVAFTDERVVDLFIKRDIDFLKRSKPHRDIILGILNEYLSNPEAETPFSKTLKSFATCSYNGIVTRGFLTTFTNGEGWKSLEKTDIHLYNFNDTILYAAVGGRNDNKVKIYQFNTTRDISVMFELYDTLAGVDAGL